VQGRLVLLPYRFCTYAEVNLLTSVAGLLISTGVRKTRARIKNHRRVSPWVAESTIQSCSGSARRPLPDEEGWHDRCV